MKIGDSQYTKYMEGIRAQYAQREAEKHVHKVTQLTESECKQEIEAITGGAKSTFAGREFESLGGSRGLELGAGLTEQGNIMTPKKKGRPKGSRNKPRV